MSIKQMVSMALVVWNLVVFITYGMDKGRQERTPIGFPKRPYYSCPILVAGWVPGQEEPIFGIRHRKVFSTSLGCRGID